MKRFSWLIMTAIITLCTSCLIAKPPRGLVIPDGESPAKGKHLLKQKQKPARIHKGKTKKPKVTKLPPRVEQQGEATITHLTPAEGRKERARIKREQHARKMAKLKKKYPDLEYHEIPPEELADAYDMPVDLARCSQDIARAMTKEKCDEIKQNRKRGRRFSHNYRRKVRSYSTEEYIAADSRDIAEIYGVPVEAVEAVKKTMRVHKQLRRENKMRP